MALNVLIAPDKFKGTLTAAEAAETMARAWRKTRPDDHLTLLPVTDGGDGFGAVMSRYLHAKACRTRTVDAAHRPYTITWWWNSETKTAVIESANVVGLAMLPPGRFHPFDLDTLGLGAVLKAANRKGARRCLIGVGGSATNDAGFGLARALGWMFRDRRGNPIQRWTELHRLNQIEEPQKPLRFDRVVVAVDVQNRLFGSNGATRVFGPQKGLRASEFGAAERNLRRLADILKARPTAGTGAAGGLSFGLQQFLAAALTPGFQLFAEQADLEKHIAAADLVVTGEGALDRSTMMGKGVGELARLCVKHKRQCIALAGMIHEPACLKRWFAHAAALTSLVSRRQATTRPREWLERLSTAVAAGFPK